MSLASSKAETPEQRVARLNAELRGKSAQEIIRAASREFGRKITYVSSFGAESAAMLSLIAEADPGMPIVFIDTGMLFHQTLQYRDTLRNFLKLTDIRNVLPVAEEVKAADPKGVLNKTDPDACCEVRKVRPLNRALEGAQGWITGLRREHSDARADVPLAEWDAERGLIKVNPVADWSTDALMAYIADNNIPVNPLHARGFVSIGCAPCTRAIQPGEDPRAGRWWWENEDKKECGLHVAETARQKEKAA
jgi:phosphoadenosine phosphosulfate reductase